MMSKGVSSIEDHNYSSSSLASFNFGNWLRLLLEVHSMIS